MDQGVDSWHPVGTALLGMHTQNLALLPALMGMKSMTNCILVLVSILCPPALWSRGKRAQGEGGDKRVLGCVANGLLWIRQQEVKQAAALPAPGSAWISRKSTEQPESSGLSELSKWE